MNEPTPEKEIKQMWRDYRFFYRMLLYAVLIGVGVLIGRAIYAAPGVGQEWGYGVNLFTGVLSTAATVLILDQLAERRADRKAEEALKRQLVDDAASLSHEIAINAIHQISRKGWLEGESGILKEADLSRVNLREARLDSANLQKARLFGTILEETKMNHANLQEAHLDRAEAKEVDLSNSNLQRAYLLETDLQGADLFEADLRGAHLRRANLQGARLGFANLQDADLNKASLIDAQFYQAQLQGVDLGLAKLQGTELAYANLQNANLSSADLRGTNLAEADLQNAYVIFATFDESTILPDYSNWTPETDMRRFTDPKHPNFWRSDYDESPAYRSKSGE